MEVGPQPRTSLETTSRDCSQGSSACADGTTRPDIDNLWPLRSIFSRRETLSRQNGRRIIHWHEGGKIRHRANATRAGGTPLTPSVCVATEQFGNGHAVHGNRHVSSRATYLAIDGSATIVAFGEPIAARLPGRGSLAVLSLIGAVAARAVARRTCLDPTGRFTRSMPS